MVAELYVAGVTIEFTKLVPERRVDPDLPTYPFERSSYWPEIKGETRFGESVAPSAKDPAPVEGAQRKTPLKLRLEQTPEALRRSVLTEEIQKILGDVLR